MAAASYVPDRGAEAIAVSGLTAGHDHSLFGCERQPRGENPLAWKEQLNRQERRGRQGIHVVAEQGGVSCRLSIPLITMHCFYGRSWPLGGSNCRS
jgi:hypothetical protein